MNTPTTDQWETWLRRKNERGWHDGFHLNKGDEAIGLCDLLNNLERERDEARGQRDRLAAALREVREMCLDKTIELHPDHDLKGTIDECIDISNDALQSLTPNQP